MAGSSTYLALVLMSLKKFVQQFKQLVLLLSHADVCILFQFGVSISEP